MAEGTGADPSRTRGAGVADGIVGRSWSVPVDDELVMGSLMAQNGDCTRRLGVFVLVVCGLLEVIMVWGVLSLVPEGGPDLAVPNDRWMSLCSIVLPVPLAIGALDVLATEAMVRFSNRRMLPGTLGQDPVPRTGTMRVSCEELGFVCDDGDGDPVRMPYAVCSGAYERHGSLYLTSGDAADRSVLHSLMGVNWALREKVAFAVPVPPEVLRAHPGVAAEVEALAERQRERAAADEAYAAELEAFIDGPDGEGAGDPGAGDAS